MAYRRFIDEDTPPLPEAIQLEKLHAITDGDKTLENQLFSLYLTTIKHCVDQMNVSLSEGVSNVWRTAARELRGASRNIGAVHMAELCRQYEPISTYDERKRALECIVEEYARIEIFIEDMDQE